MKCPDKFKGDGIGGVLRTALAAVETYERAVGERTWDLLRGEHAQHLVNILTDHLEVSSELHQMRFAIRHSQPHRRWLACLHENTVYSKIFHQGRTIRTAQETGFRARGSTVAPPIRTRPSPSSVGGVSVGFAGLTSSGRTQPCLAFRFRRGSLKGDCENFPVTALTRVCALSALSPGYRRRPLRGLA